MSDKLPEYCRLELRHNQLFDVKYVAVEKIKKKGYKLINVDFDAERMIEIFTFKLKEQSND